ncbi:SRPBCC family protein [Hyphococcus lacteus]|uniref:SRPBCC domain-containing protein n=1 Tax=Hyphococcus lacteus TaxID=3143536 RepID=A0ABV3Z4S6_9PROT
MSKMQIVKTLFLKAPPEHVWKFLTEADRMAEWFHRGGNDLAEGGDYVLETNTYGKEGETLCWGHVLEMKKPERLVHTFTHKFIDGAETKCTWTLEAVSGGTILTLVHDGWEKVAQDAFNAAADHDIGWDEHFTRLRRVAN